MQVNKTPSRNKDYSRIVYELFERKLVYFSVVYYLGIIMAEHYAQLPDIDPTP